MARRPHNTDFPVPVEGIGTFTFAQRKMADEIKIQAEYARMIDGTEPTQWLSLVAGWISALTVLTVHAPAGWDLDELDPLDDESYAKMKRVYDALVEKEQSFRGNKGQARQGERTGAGDHNGVLVSAEVQPPSD